MIQPVLIGASAAAGGGGDPLDYGSNLVAFWNAENGVTTSSGEVTQWTDQGSSINLERRSGDPGPDFIASDQNSLPGLDFEDPLSGSDRLSRRLRTSDSAFDEYFVGTGRKGIAFAGRWDRASDGFGFDTASVIAQKGWEHNEGWRLDIQSNGTIRFRHRMLDNSIWQMTASGFYSVGDLVLGSMNYSGGNTTGSGEFRLYNGSTFVETGTISLANNNNKQDESARDLSIGNTLDDDVANNNAPFEGSLFAVWFTKPYSNSLDDNYMRRWIP